MTDVETLIRRIDHELTADVERQKADWVARARTIRERGPRLQRCEAVAQHLIAGPVTSAPRDTASACVPSARRPP